MSSGGSVRAVARRTRSPVAAAPSARARTTSITVYGCGQDEAAVFRELAPSWGVLPTITDAAVSEANVDLASGARCVSVGHKTPVGEPTIRALAHAGVRYISTRSVGYDHIDVEYAESIGVRVGNVRYSPDGVADFTLMLILMAIRHAMPIVRRVDTRDYRLGDVRGKELRDLTVGVVGAGRIGTAVIDRLRGFGCQVLAHDRRGTRAAQDVPLDELLRRSDVVTLHIPLDEHTHHLLDEGRIGRMKRGAVVVNTGRGALLDTDALVTALERGRLGGAALDVLEGEDGIFYTDCRDRPVENDWLARLHRLPNVIVSPHTAYYTDRALADTVENSLVNCLNFESGYQRG